MRIGVQGWLTTPQPMDYGVVRGLCAALRGRYPTLRSVPVGRSLLGRDIPALVLSVGACQQRVLMGAAFHGQEWLTALCALRLCEELCTALQGGLTLCGIPVTRAMQGRQIWFVPLVNPDGVEIARYGSGAAGEYAALARATGADTPGLWQANARGVDINSNFNAGWAEMQALAQKNGKNLPGARKYPGPAPESEPETRAVCALCRRYAFRHVVALHSQGEEIYWAYGEHTPPQSEMMARVMAEASGYAVAQPEGLAVHAGFKDWFIQTYHRPGFTLELGRGCNPLPVAQFEEMYDKAREMLALSVLL
ncbi:MAG: gamma-D-glutamyl-meso-diaminopimelate peptidase [Ruminococcaceae bacterium]|nr:gamma-D-glutamyl-meso-diaminopimelate peptidase [Oscillospiraceae bacterium]